MMNTKKIDALVSLANASNFFEWIRWSEEIPYIQFPKDWKVKIIPPFHGAIVRFRIQLPNMKPNDFISVYLDCYGVLGAEALPHWEIYPYDEDVGRCGIYDVEELLRMIGSNGK